MLPLLEQLLTIPSPTFHEQEKVKFLRDWTGKNLRGAEILEHKDSLIISLPKKAGRPHVVLVGHSDVVPAWFPVRHEGDRLHGPGGSDMLGAVAAFMDVVAQHQEAIGCNISLLIYSREEGTPIHDNGLYDLIQFMPEWFKTVDLAVVGEPTDNTVQIGCCGSLHLRVKVKGLACHSARPWNGSNALYKALPFIQAMSQLAPVKHRVFGCDFFDVLQITEERCEPGRTSLPGWWEANVNFRYAPVRGPQEAFDHATGFINGLKVPDLEVSLIDDAPSGKVIETPLFTRAVEILAAPVEAKQAWTDVAQLSALGVPCFNFGPGLTSQAHKADEFILKSDCLKYREMLEKLLLSL